MLVHTVEDHHLEQCLAEAGEQQTDDDGDDGGHCLAVLIDRRLIWEAGKDQYGDDGDETAHRELRALGPAHDENSLLIEEIVIHHQAG